jgi:GNAT superfamily N-acetyltransferase
MATHLRVADVLEADAVSKLIYYAYKEFAHLLCNADEESIVLERLKQLSLHSKPSPVTLSVFRTMADTNENILGGFAAYPITQTLLLYQNLYQALLEYSFFAALDTKIKLSPRLISILGNDTAWQLPYYNAYYLDAFALAPEHRGKNLAPQMMEHVKKRACEEGCTSVVLLAREDMVQFYSKLQFNTNQFLDTGEEDFFVMHLPL